MMDTRPRLSVQTHRMHSTKWTLSVNSVLWVIMMCQCRVTNCHKGWGWPTLLPGVGVVEKVVPVWRQGLYGKISIPSSQFFCELKTDLEIKVFKINLCMSQTCVTSQRLPTQWIPYLFVTDLLILDGIYFFIGFLLLGYKPVEEWDWSYYFPVSMAQYSPWHKISTLLISVELLNERVVSKAYGSPTSMY